MLNAGPRGGWGTGATTVPPNPFNTAMPPPGNPFAKPRPNPFLQDGKPSTQAALSNPFDTSATTSAAPSNPFSATATPSFKRSASPSSKQTVNGMKAHNPFETVAQAAPGLGSQASRALSAGSRRPSPSPSTNSLKRAAEFVQPAWSSAPATSQLRPSDPNIQKGSFGTQGNKQNGRGLPTPIGLAKKHSPAGGLGSNAQTVLPKGAQNGASNSSDGRSYAFASKIQQQLARDRIKPPQWPSNPGSHLQRQAMETFRESYKAYREKARKSLIKAGLIDDPDQRRTLQQALDFRGISDEMCPEWEKVTRIIEYDVRNPEKANDDDGDLVAVPSLMVKRLARSAAGQDAPLPMDVRSFATLRKTLDYLIDDLIPDDSLLPSKHNFLWDRTRAIRIDLSVQKYNLTPGERTDLVYCLETIARFHVTALHLLSQDGFAAEDFSEQQEIEQLGKTLISLKEVYDDCGEQGIECPNEAEFRGYYIVFNARNPSIKETVEGWGSRLWNSDGIRTAMCLVESLQNTWTLQGPLNPYAPTEISIGAAAIFFSIVSSPQISYTMACFAEIHFNDVRKTMLQVMRKAYSRPREGPKDITPAFLKERLRFDTEDEAADFAEKHGIVFGQDGNQRYAILNSRQSIEDPRIRHAFSQSIVEYKRSNRPLPEVIHRTVYHKPTDDDKVSDPSSGLFVDSVDDTPFDMPDGPVHGNATQNPDSTMLSNPVMSTPAQPPPTENHSKAQSQSTTSSLFSGLNGSATTLNHPAPVSTVSNGFVSAQSPNLQAPSALSSQSITPSAEIISSVFDNSGGKSEPIANTSAWTPNDNGAAISNNSIPAMSNGAASPSIFSFLNGNENGSSKQVEPQLKSGLGVGSPLKPASFFSSDVASKSTAVQSPALSVSSSHLQGPNKQNSQSLFTPTPPSAAPVDKGAVISDPTSAPSPQPPRPTSPTAFNIANTPNFFESATKSWLTPTPEPRTASSVPEMPSAAVPSVTEPKKDPMGDFARWLVLADKGLMQEELEEFAVKHILKTTWENFKADEAKRIAQEEDEKSWAEALQFRNRSLKVTFFYRWLNITRKRRVVRRIRLEKEKARKWNSPESIRQREMEAKAAKKRRMQEAKELMTEMTEMTKEHTQDLANMRESTQSHVKIEEALLATGVFSGVPDERAAARYAAQDDNIDSESDIVSAGQLRLRSENQRRRTRGLPPLKQFPEAKTYRAGSKTAMLRAISSGSGRETMSLSTGSLRNSTYSSSYRSSLGFNPNRVSKSRLHGTDPYWQMKANGLIQMPNGDYLHESLALPMHEGKRFHGIGNYGLPPAKSFTPSESPPRDTNFVIPEPISPTPAKFHGGNQESTSPILNVAAQKRKRGEIEDEDLVAYRNEVPASRKRAKSKDRAAPTMPSPDQDLLHNIENLLSQVNEVTTSSRLSRPGSRQTIHSR